MQFIQFVAEKKNHKTFFEYLTKSGIKSLIILCINLLLFLPIIIYYVTTENNIIWQNIGFRLAFFGWVILLTLWLLYLLIFPILVKKILTNNNQEQSIWLKDYLKGKIPYDSPEPSLSTAKFRKLLLIDAWIEIILVEILWILLVVLGVAFLTSFNSDNVFLNGYSRTVVGFSVFFAIFGSIKYTNQSFANTALIQQLTFFYHVNYELKPH